jgi:hypothetical protein
MLFVITLAPVLYSRHKRSCFAFGVDFSSCAMSRLEGEEREKDRKRERERGGGGEIRTGSIELPWQASGIGEINLGDKQHTVET